MSQNEFPPSARFRGRAILFVLSGTAVCLALSLLLNYLLLFSDTLTPFGRSVITAVVLPILIGAPLLSYIALKTGEIAGYRQELTRAATYDRLTDTLNGTAFSNVVERRARAPEGGGPRRGVFLVVHTDQLNAINRQYGYDWGDEALRLVAATIRASVRGGDIVGRVGAGDFGVFLPGATEENGREIGERIRRGVAKVYFLPRGEESTLRVSVKGVVFESDLGFHEIFRAALGEASSGELGGAVRPLELPGPSPQA